MLQVVKQIEKILDSKVITYSIQLSKIDYIEHQLRLIFGTDTKELSNGELKVLCYLSLYPEIKEAKFQIINNGVRTSKKSIDNDITKFKDLNIIEVVDCKVKFNDSIIVYFQPSYLLTKIELI